MYIVFISHRLAVLFAFETEEGCRSSEIVFFKLKTVCLYLNIYLFIFNEVRASDDHMLDVPLIIPIYFCLLFCIIFWGGGGLGWGEVGWVGGR